MSGGSHMTSSQKTRTRMDERVNDLLAHFSECLDYFDERETFTGPSVYFHGKTLAVRRSHNTAAELLQDDLFFDYLYATLTAWGLHRMGQGNTKLVDIGELRASLRSESAPLQSLWPHSLTDLNAGDLPDITKRLWAALTGLRVSIAEAQIVANSKALHHVLPSLVPPIDRTYTYKFFYNRTMLSLPEHEAFGEIYQQFHRVATSKRAEIHAHTGHGFHTSETKVVDNAIIGYVKKNLRETTEHS